jgi:hypothetical protein
VTLGHLPDGLLLGTWFNLITAWSVYSFLSQHWISAWLAQTARVPLQYQWHRNGFLNSGMFWSHRREEGTMMKPNHTDHTKASAEHVVKDIRGATRLHFSAEDKIKIVLDGLRGEDSIAEPCRKEGPD